jgi:hypothetical protein
MPFAGTCETQRCSRRACGRREPTASDRHNESLYNSRLRAISSAVEHCIHTAGVTCSIHVSPTIYRINQRLKADQSFQSFFVGAYRLGFGQSDTLLALVFTATVAVTGLAHIVWGAFKKQDLRTALASINLGRQRRRVTEL